MQRLKVAKIPAALVAALSILNSSGATKKVATLVARASCSGASCSGASHSSANIIYEYSCCIGNCELQNCSYIGITTKTLSSRLTMHLA